MIIRWTITETGSEMAGEVSIEACIANDNLPKNLKKISEDSLDWWDEAEEDTIDATPIVNAIGNFQENTTFLQITKEDVDLSDLAVVLKLKSKFMDYTDPARKMSKKLYKKLFNY